MCFFPRPPCLHTCGTIMTNIGFLIIIWVADTVDGHYLIAKKTKMEDENKKKHLANGYT